MSDNSKIEELKYQDRLNISVVSIKKVKKLLQNDILDTLYCWDKGKEVDKQCYRIVGPAGLGKTKICYQLAKELTEEIYGEWNEKNPQEKKVFDILMIKSPVLSRDDFILPFPVTSNDSGDETGYSFKMLYSDFVPKHKETAGIFVIDECSRGDHQLQQLMWQIQDEYAIHKLQFPKKWFVITIDNPDDAEYSMDNLEDAAGLRRQLHLYVEVSAMDFLEYAIKNEFHPFVIEYIQTHPERLYDFMAQKTGAVYANPASYEKLSDHLWKMQIRRGNIDFDEIEIKASGLLNTHQANLFITFARDKKDINPKDIFFNYNNIKHQINDLLKTNNMSKLGELMISFCTYMTTSMPVYNNQNLKNIMEFLISMPVDTSALFISQLDGFERTSPAFKYMSTIHLTLMKNDKRYKEEFFDPIHSAAEGKV